MSQIKISINRKLRFFVKNIHLSYKNTIKVYRIKSDIFLTKSSVRLHTDGTESGKDTVLLVILNESKPRFLLRNKSTVLSIGDIIRFSGNTTHGLKCIKSGRFCALIWDVPIKKPTNRVINEVKTRVFQLTKRI